MENVYLIVGLGNPGKEYAATRHNAGFLLVEDLAQHWNVEWKPEKKFQSQVAKNEIGGKRILLCEPQTFMNASGEAVGALVNFYQTPVEKILIVVDDADLPLGTIRLRGEGSSGGHHGLESIEEHLGTRNFARLKIGIGRKNGAREITGHVLGRFAADERKILEEVLAGASEQVKCWIDKGIGEAMNRFNRTVNQESKT